MNRKEYMRQINLLPVQIDFAEDLLLFAPHITLKQSERILELSREGHYGFCFAGPSVLNASTLRFFRIDNSQTLLLTKTVSPSKHHQFQIEIMQQAQKCAKDNWGYKQISDTWQNYVQIHLQDPFELREWISSKEPEKSRIEPVIATIHFGTDRKWLEITTDLSNPLSRIINESIIHPTTNLREGEELLGNRKMITELAVCANCGTGFTVKGCEICKVSVDSQYAWKEPTPLPKQLENLVRDMGHGFIIPLSESRSREQERWEQLRKT